MIKRKQIRILAVFLSMILLISSMIPTDSFVQAEKVSKDVNKILSNLTDEQRNALNTLEAEVGFTIHPGINTESTNQVNVIVEFKQDPAKVAVAKAKVAKERSNVTLSEAEKKVEASHEQFKKELQRLNKTKNFKENGSEAEITLAFRDAFNGVAMTLPGNAIQDLFQTGVVERVWKDETVRLDLPKTKSKKVEPKMADSIPQIGVDDLHAEDIKGQGIKVGVIDTGIDYNHPDLQQAYAGYRAEAEEDPSTVDPNNVKGWDYVENDADPMEMTYEEWQESGQPEFDNYGNSYYTSHGTHVSGTVAAQKKNDVDYAVKGVAPAVDLYHYRVLGAYGSGQTAWVLAGIDKAVKDNMDVINLSLGMNVNDPLTPTSVAVNNAMLVDIVTVVAAGNAGPGDKTVGSPGTAALPISVGASDVSQNIPMFTATAAEEQFSNVKLLAKNFTDNLTDLQDQSYSVVNVGIGTVGDFEGKDVTGKIALIERGDIAFDEKVRNAKDAGAKAAIVYNNEPGQIPFYIGENTAYLPAFRLTKEDGNKLKNGLAEETIFTFGELKNTKSEGDHLADFSSRGPVAQNFDIKPDVVAPGVAIFSTSPFFMNDPEGNNYDAAYERMQGTSMASPHVAGTAALILQENPDYTAFDVKAALMNTSVDLREDYSVYEVGAGRINAYEAVHADVSIKVLDQTEMVEGEETILIDEETGSMAFGSHFKTGEAIEDNSEIRIENRSPEAQTFNVKVDYHEKHEGIQSSEENEIHLEVPSSIEVSGNGSEKVSSKIIVPENAKEGRYEGFIHLTNAKDSSETYQIPFAIRITEKGFDYLETDRPALANNTPKWQHYYPTLSAAFQMKSPMNTIDIIVKDGQTGEAIGLVATVKDDTAKADFRYYIPHVFGGSVYPFTNDSENPISEVPIELSEGEYALEFIGYNESKQAYSVDTPFFIDNTKPEVNFDNPPGVYEINEDMYTEEFGKKAYWIHGDIQDETVDLLQSEGLDYDQSSNKFYFAQGEREYFNCCFPSVDTKGNANFGIEPSDIEDKPLKIALAGTDIARNVNYQRYIFLQDGTEYLTSSYNKEDVKLDDTVTMTLSANNLKNFISGEFTVEFKEDHYSFESVKLNETFKNYIEEKNLEVSLMEPEISDDDYYNLVKVGATVQGEGFSGINEDIPLLDVTFKVTSDHWFYGYDKFDVITSNYTKAGETEAVSLPYYSTSNFEFISQHSTIQGYIMPEAFLKQGSTAPFLPVGVAQEIGANVYALSPDGQRYEGTIDKRGKYTIQDVPADGKEYKAVVEIPGHLKTYTSFISGYELKGEYYGDFTNLGYKINAAGDVNDDAVIDIMDVMRAVAHYGKENNKSDINNDGVVDETDIRFIEKNFLKVGPDVKGNKQPKETLGKKGLDDFLQAVGLEPMND